jgi:GNAT superfamily N-acetyltransferase
VKAPAVGATIAGVTSGQPCDVVVRRATLDEIFALRHAELRPGLPRGSAEFAGDTSPTTRHFAAFATDSRLADDRLAASSDDGGGLPTRRPASSRDAVGCASFRVEPYAGAAAHQLRGMATRADLARRGIGSALLRHAVADLVAYDGARMFWCNARVAAIPFYRRMGWEIASDVFDVPTVGPHRVMTFVADHSSVGQP